MHLMIASSEIAHFEHQRFQSAQSTELKFIFTVCAGHDGSESQ